MKKARITQRTRWDTRPFHAISLCKKKPTKLWKKGIKDSMDIQASKEE